MTLIRTLTAFALGMSAFGALAQTVVGVSWSNFQEERWKTDEAAIKAALTAAGAKYISADAQSDPTKQLNDVQSLIAGGAKALIVLAQDAKAIEPAIIASSKQRALAQEFLQFLKRDSTVRVLQSYGFAVSR